MYRFEFPEIPAPTTVSTTESYYRNSKHKKPYPMPNDFGVEELKENGKLALPFFLKIISFPHKNIDQNSILTSEYSDYLDSSGGPPYIRNPPGAYNSSSHPLHSINALYTLILNNLIIISVCQSLLFLRITTTTTTMMMSSRTRGSISIENNR